jgi:hypothetical protein
MSVVQRARQGTSFGLCILLIFTMGPGVGISMAGQATPARCRPLHPRHRPIRDKARRSFEVEVK